MGPQSWMLAWFLSQLFFPSSCFTVSKHDGVCVVSTPPFPVVVPFFTAFDVLQ